MDPINNNNVNNMSEDEEVPRAQQGVNNNRAPRVNRHTPEQIRAMEDFFRECPHPNTQQRNELSRMIGMEPLQIKFWFQNKRTQMKSRHDRMTNRQLMEENERLRAENMRFREALNNAHCSVCGRAATVTDFVSPDERELRLENARLKQEIEQYIANGGNKGGPNFNNGAGGSSSSNNN